MFSNQPAELLLPTPLRTCTAIPASKSTSRYLVGTACPPGGHNVVHLLRYHEEANELGQDAQLDHPTGECWCLASCPADATVLVTCGGGGGGGAASTKVWRVPRDVVEKDDELGYDDDEEEEGDGVPSSSGNIGASEVTDMTSQATLFVDSDDALGGRISCALFRPTAEDEFGLDGGGGGSFGMSGGDGAGLGIDSSKDLITVSAYGGTITRWDLEAGAAEVGRIASAALSGPNDVGGGGGGIAERRAAWDPHNHNLIAVTGRNGITLHDLRTADGGGGGGGNAMHLSTDVDLDITDIGKYHGLGNHRYGTTDVSYNPNLPNVLTTSGKDGLIKFWDLRTTSSSSSSSSSSYSTSSSGGAAKTKQNGRRSAIRPIKILRGGHNHWSNRVSYNPHHDQLLLSSGTDGVVNLWRVGSVSSAPLLDLDDALLPSEDGGGGAAMTADEDRQDLQTKDDKEDQDGGGGAAAGGGAEGGADARVSTFDFPDSVYDITWSASDAWTFLAVGYDGTVALNHVPSREKYKILL